MKKTAPEFTLTYFDDEGGAEMIRLAFAIGNIPFTDERLSAEQWQVRKPNTPFRGLPVLSIDGKQMAQSMAILRYVGKLAGLYPSDPIKALQVDEIVTAIMDYAGAALSATRVDPEKQEEAQKQFLENIPEQFGAIERRLVAFGSGPWCVGDSVTIADLAMYTLLAYFQAKRVDYIPSDGHDGFERSVACCFATKGLPAVKAWIEEHNSFAIQS